MSPTSTELRPRSAARFRRALTGLLVVLAVLLAGFLALGYLQGPKLSSAQVDVKSVITQSGQQLRLFANQSVAHVENAQVTVSPDVAHSVSTQGHVIAVQFDARLRYATTYTVTVKDVTSVYQAQPTTISYAFTTATPTLYYLDRGQPDDAIVTTTLGNTGRTVVYSAPHIQDFVRTANALAVVTLSADKTSALSLVSLTDGAVESVPLPEPGVIEDLQAAATGTLIGFTFTSATESLQPNYSSTLLTLDLEGAGKPSPATGVDGTPLRVVGWEFTPDGSTLLALSRERDLLLVDPLTTGSVTPLGQFTGLGMISRDGTTVTMEDALGTSTVTIATGAQQRLPPPHLENDSSLTYLGAVEMLAGGSRIEHLLISQAGGRRFASVIAIDDGGTAKVIYRTPQDAGGIDGFTVSPNGQYVSVEVDPDTAASVSDGYFYDAKSTSIETMIVDISSGALVKGVEGFALNW